MKVILALAALLVLSCSPPPVDEVAATHDGGVIQAITSAQTCAGTSIDPACPPGQGAVDIDVVGTYTLWDYFISSGQPPEWTSDYGTQQMMCGRLKVQVNQLFWDWQVVNGQPRLVLAGNTVREVLLSPVRTIGKLGVGGTEGEIRQGIQSCWWHSRIFLPPGRYNIWTSMACPDQKINGGYSNQPLIQYTPAYDWLQAGQSYSLTNFSVQGPWNQKMFYRDSLASCGLDTSRYTGAQVNHRTCTVQTLPCPEDKWYYWTW